MESLLNLSATLDGFFWGQIMIYLCLAAGVYFSILMRFPQLRLVKDMVKQLIGGKASASGVCHHFKDLQWLWVAV